MSDLGVSDQFLAALDRLEVSYEFDDFGTFALTDAFVSAGALSAVSRLCDNYGIELAVADNVLVARRKGLDAMHLNHHPYYTVV